jgi:hypothetical protein
MEGRPFSPEAAHLEFIQGGNPAGSSQEELVWLMDYPKGHGLGSPGQR